jgi:hypothetical protein
VTFFQAELGPCSALRDLRIDVFADDGCFNAAGDFYFLAFVIEAV